MIKFLKLSYSVSKIDCFIPDNYHYDYILCMTGRGEQLTNKQFNNLINKLLAINILKHSHFMNFEIEDMNVDLLNMLTIDFNQKYNKKDLSRAIKIKDSLKRNNVTVNYSN